VRDNADAIREAVRAIVGEHVDVPEDDAVAHDADSLALVQIVEALEDRFGFRVPPRDVTAKNFASVSALVTYVEGRTR
jgi:acyl carrier protein